MAQESACDKLVNSSTLLTKGPYETDSTPWLEKERQNWLKMKEQAVEVMYFKLPVLS